MNNKISGIFSVISFILVLACENELKLDMPKVESTMVVEGWIEQGQGAKVLLSMSAPFFTEIDSVTLRQYAVTGAKVTISSGSESEVLTLASNDAYFPTYYYFSSDMEGKLNQEYSIEIRYHGYIYTGQTTIPDLVKPDSVWFEKQDVNDTLGLLMIRINDKPETPNYYRTLTKRLGKDNKFIPTFTSVFTDVAFNGKIIDIPLSKGNLSVLDIENSRFFNVGDTIILKFCSIDRQQYKFWTAIQGQIQNSANPFAMNGTEALSNINGGLGIWAGNAVSYDTIIAK